MQWKPCNFQPFDCAFAGREIQDLSRFEASLFVGYNSITVPADRLYIAAIHFTEVSGVSELPIKDVLSVDNPQGSAEMDSTADQIWIWNTAAMNWVKYYYRTTGRGATKKTIGWVKDGGDVDTETTDTVKNGDAFFFSRSGNAEGVITFSGAVKMTNADPVALTADRLHFICNPWPTAISIKSITEMLDTVYGSAEMDSTADQIWAWDTTAMNWVKYYYRTTGRGASKVTIGWVKDGGDDSKETSDQIGVGQGFFFSRSGNGNGILSWPKPAGL